MADTYFLTSSEQRKLVTLSPELRKSIEKHIQTEQSFGPVDQQTVFKRLQDISFAETSEARHFQKRIQRMHAAEQPVETISLADVPAELLPMILACLGPEGLTRVIEDLLADIDGDDVLPAIASLSKFRHELRLREQRMDSSSKRP